ncbi:MAG: ABC transporter ATP-binding protein [Lachnospiraceae bacterium]|nr:ABC transporter ATP-binding protein [Lachnospiraceae bacterium]
MGDAQIISSTELVSIVFGLITYLIASIGYCALFRKSGRKPLYAFVPVVRDYQLAVSVEREEEGRTYCIMMACGYLANLSQILYPEGTTLYILLVAIRLVFQIAALVYAIRIYLGLCDMYGRSRRWILAFILFDCITSFIWGFNKDFQPKKQVKDVDPEQIAAVSGATAEAITDGLTVNLTDRTVIDFFRKRVLLKDIHLSIPKGRMVLLLGGSGAGKTTFLNAVTGYEKANAKIQLNGGDIYSNYETMKHDIGFVPQLDLMRGNDTVQMTLRDAAAIRLPKNLSRTERNQRIHEVLDRFGLLSVRNHLVEKLSGGQRKRLSICMELISDPNLFILDEPDSGLDGVVARNLFELLRSIADEGKIVIVITHTPDHVIDLFDDVIVLAKDAGRTGRLAWYGPVSEAYEFFGKTSMEEILLSINQKDEGGEGRADEFVEKYGQMVLSKAG